ncbi:Ankyrin repeat domain-containing protein 17 [Fusarium oxysporum f. sp. rapae]|uniref:Ankyrin repeat domain-containing protein 17 n=1 Tax=Fusarium oxysporum f. sp. rapae TaxID=485398 RepID=A0A8J5NK08_FUSOX|nr:Ankyrin repeat domain-containing protein 17 [Fusarium oxysporum f. sp. rapae]
MGPLDNEKRSRGGTAGEEPLLDISKLQGTNYEDDNSGWGHRQDCTLGPLSHDDYNVGWVCALPIEMAAARAMLDNVHGSLPGGSNDSNAYTLGNIGMHNIVIACLPSGHYGISNAATVANNMRRSFLSIHIRLMVGIGGGVPGRVDVRLGDIVVSDRVVQYDFGKTVGDGCFERTGIINRPPQEIMTTVSKLRADHESARSRIPSILSEMLERNPSMAKYTNPGPLKDQLFQNTYDHVQSLSNCDQCDPSKLVNRPRRGSTHPKIHYGVIASGNQVMKHAKTRDKLAQELDVLCFEMEAAGLMDSFPCLAIRGICDYSDSHKNKQWQKYAAAAAAAYAKELLSVIPSSRVPKVPTVRTNCATEQHALSDRRKALRPASDFTKHLGHGLVDANTVDTTWAAKYGFVEVVKELLKNGADVASRDDDGDTPLLLAALKGHEAVAKLLVEKSADLEARNKSGDTPLLLAAYYGREAVVTLLLEKGASVRAKNKSGNTALLEAAGNGHKTVARLLVDKVADFEAKRYNGNTPLLRAAGNGHEAVVELLLEKGARKGLRYRFFCN